MLRRECLIGWKYHTLEAHVSPQLVIFGKLPTKITSLLNWCLTNEQDSLP